jgi:hypothetical protein
LRAPRHRTPYLVALAWVALAVALYGFQIIGLVGELG